MSAASSPVQEPHPLLQGASPRTIREWLSPELAQRFDDDYRTAIDTARSTYELEPVNTVVEDWRGIAILAADPTAFRRTMRAAAELATGKPSPDDEPRQTTLTKAGLQVYVVAGDAVREATSALPAQPLPATAELRAARELAPHRLRVVEFGDRERAQLVQVVIDRDRLASLLRLRKSEHDR